MFIYNIVGYNFNLVGYPHMRNIFFKHDEKLSPVRGADWLISVAIVFSFSPFFIAPKFFLPVLIISGLPTILSILFKKASWSRLVYVFSLISFSFVSLVFALVAYADIFLIFSALYLLVAILILFKPYTLRDLIAGILSVGSNIILWLIFRKLCYYWWLPFIGFGLPISYFFTYLVIHTRFREIENDALLLF